MTKKFNYKRLAACCLTVFSLFNTLYSQAAVGDSFTKGGLQYTVLTEDGSAGTVEVKQKVYVSVSGYLPIPASVENNGITYNITSIADYAFYKSTILDGITLPNTVTTIGKYAFAGCQNLRFAALPWNGDALTIGEYAFTSCHSLRYIAIPQKTVIGDYAFYDCRGLRRVTETQYIGWGVDDVTTIGSYAFCKCANLESVSLETVEFIGDYAFAECPRLYSVVLSNNNIIKAIGKYAFSACSFLRYISIPDSVTSIGDAAFYKSTALVGVIFAGDAPTVGEYVFQNTNATIYYFAGTKGWPYNHEWAGRPTQQLVTPLVVLHGEVFSASEGEKSPIEGKIYYKIEGSTMTIAFTGTLYESEDAVNWVSIEDAEDIYRVSIEKAKGKFYRSKLY